MADRSEVLELLRIADLSKQWPHLKPLHDHAMKSLQQAADEHKPKEENDKEEKPGAKPLLRPPGLGGR